MPLPRRMARVNRRLTNRVIGRVAPRLPGLGVVVHRGRRSGRQYRTPVSVFAAADGYVVALTYGAESDWVQNVLAEQACGLEHRGRQLRLVTPRLVHDETRAQVPPAVRLALRLLRVSDFLVLRPEPEPSGEAGAPAPGNGPISPGKPRSDPGSS